ncbi:MAG TPA: hypothetical protein VEO01_19140 [Pseudonocardiaceae bacterium]|nr:hypothetical protein [Pseudonocardiaceae bacterium]
MTGSLPSTGQQPTPEDAGSAGSVTSQWAEVYPPDGEEPEPEPTDMRSNPATPPAAVVVTGLFVVTAVLVVVGSVTPLFQAFQVSAVLGPSFTSAVTMDGWHLTSANQASNVTLPPSVTPAPIPLGYPLLVLALLAAAVVVLRLLVRRRPWTYRLAGVLGVVTAGFLIGLVFTLGMFEIAWRALSTSAAIGPVTTTIGVGYWMLVVATLLAGLAVVIAYRMPTTPVADFEVPDQQPEADPLVPPGQPAEWPVVAVIPNDERTNW